jgi:hypothetical protein
MDDDPRLDEKAYAYVAKLSAEIGPRPAGSAAEKQAQLFVSDELRRLGYDPIQSKFKFSRLPLFYPINLICSLILISAGWAVHFFPEFSIWTPILFSFIPTLSPWLWNLRKRTQDSSNVVAYTELHSNKPTLIFCAHVDSGRALPIRNKLFLEFFSNSMNLLQRTAFLITAVSIFVLLGLNIPAWLFWFVGIAGSLVGGALIVIDLFNQFAHGNHYSPGAIDNASGVGVCLALAEYLASNPSKRLRFGFLFTGAEETGLHGAEAFASQFGQESGVKGVVNLDMIGAGDSICIVTKAGGFLAQFTDLKLNEQMKGAFPGLETIQYTLRRGDFIPFLQNKIPAISLETKGSRPAGLAYHTLDDQMENIDLLTLDIVLKGLIKFVEVLPYSDWAFSKKE